MTTPISALVLRDLLANRPAAGIAGRVFYATDTRKLYRDNGSGWDLEDFAAYAAVLTKTSNYSMSTTDDKIIANAAGLTITLPNATAVIPGYAYYVFNGASGTNTTIASAGGLIIGSSTYTALTLAYQSAGFVSDGTNWLMV